MRVSRTVNTTFSYGNLSRERSGSSYEANFSCLLERLINLRQRPGYVDRCCKRAQGYTREGRLLRFDWLRRVTSLTVVIIVDRWRVANKPPLAARRYEIERNYFGSGSNSRDVTTLDINFTRFLATFPESRLQNENKSANVIYAKK